MEKSKRYQPVTAGDCVIKFLKTNKYLKRVRDHSLWKQWDDCLPESITQDARPYSFKRKCLTIIVTNPATANELHLQKDILIKAINKASGKKDVNDIKFKVGALPYIHKTSNYYPKRIAPKVDQTTLDNISDKLNVIKDEEIKATFRRLIRKHYGLEPDKP